jgi:predicted transcriptional regulator
MTAIKGKNVRVDDETYEKIHQLAKEEERTLSMIIQRAIREYWNSDHLGDPTLERVEPSIEKDTTSYIGYD